MSVGGTPGTPGVVVTSDGKIQLPVVGTLSVVGKTVTEAMACGTPVVASAVGGIPEQIDDGTEGFLLPAGDAEGMAARIASLLTDRALRDACSRAAVQRASRYDVCTQIDRFLEWYEELRRNPSPSPASVTAPTASVPRVPSVP